MAEVIEAVKQKILTLLDANPEGLRREELIRQTPSSSEMPMEPKTRASAINKLLEQGLVEIDRDSDGGSFTLKLRRGTRLDNASPEEQTVFTLIEEADRQGMWIRTIRDKTGLSEIQLRKVLKSLEQKKLVKSLKAVGTTRKCYILYNLEADRSISGGTFYENAQIDAQFVQALSNICVKMLQARRKRAEEMHKEDLLAQSGASYVSSEEVANYISSKGIVKFRLEVEEVERILGVCALEGELEECPTDGRLYRAKKEKPVRSALTTLPCLYCPVRKECRPGYEISPATCVYFKEHFDL